MDNEQNQKKSNLRVALFLAGLAMLIALWPLYILRNGL
jgi:hypothetical protein